MKKPVKLLKFLFIFAISQFIATVSVNAFACTVVFWNNNGVTKIAARTMDLFMDEEPIFVVYPKNISHSGHAGENSLKWTSRYGSLVVSSKKTKGEGSAEGMNEEGLAASLLYLDDAIYEKRNPKIPGVSNAYWVQYILDNFKTVQEVIDNVPDFQVVSVTSLGQIWPFHLILQDTTGDFAVFEYIKGKLVIHHGKQYNVVTNEPAYDVQLANLKRYKLFGGKLPLPGDPDPLSRFVRAASYFKTVPKPKDEMEAATTLWGVIKTVAVPMGAEDTSGNETVDAWPTRWTDIKDLTNKIFYFNAANMPNAIWVDFSRLKLNAGDPIMSFDPADPKLSGDVTNNFMPFTPPG